MDKINLNDRNNTHDAIAHGVVQMKRLNDGKILFNKHNMITLTGRKLIFNKMFGSSTNEISHIFIGDGYNVTYAEMTWNDVQQSNVNYEKLVDANKKYNLLGENSNNYTYTNNIDYTSMNSLVFMPAKSDTTNQENDLEGRVVTAFPSASVVFIDGKCRVQLIENGSSVHYETGMFQNADNENRYENRPNRFTTIDGSLAFVRIDDIANFKKFLKYFHYVFEYKTDLVNYIKIDETTDDLTVSNFLNSGTDTNINIRKTLLSYIPLPYVEDATYGVDSETGNIKVTLPGDTQLDPTGEDTVIVLNTPAIISDEPFLKITKVFDGSQINKSVTELGLLYSDSTNNDVTSDDLELFSRVIFESIPMVSGNTFEVSYYIYF